MSISSLETIEMMYYEGSSSREEKLGTVRKQSDKGPSLLKDPSCLSYRSSLPAESLYRLIPYG